MHSLHIFGCLDSTVVQYFESNENWIDRVVAHFKIQMKNNTSPYDLNEDEVAAILEQEQLEGKPILAFLAHFCDQLVSFNFNLLIFCTF